MNNTHAAPPQPAGPPTIELRGSQIVGPAQEDRGEVDWLARKNNWRRDSGAAHAEWLKAMHAWRQTQLGKIAFDDARYRRPDLLWTQANFVQPQAMVEDRFLYDPLTRRYTVDRFLADLNKRYGGIDSVLLWPVYPNLGIDSRNQWDALRDMPGGVAGLRAMVKQFQARGVRVFFPTMPWDDGSRDPRLSRAEATTRLLAEIGADGINGDTMSGLPLDFARAADASGRPLALEPELAFSDDAMLAWNQHSWGYWETPFVPLVSKWKWLEPRHMVHVCDRWATDRSNILQAAFFNGVGVESWENVWGWWNQFTARDAEALRRIAAIYRTLPELLVSPDWTPHVPTLHYGVYASSFPGREQTLWTLVNRNDFNISGAVLSLEHRAGRRYFDLWQGRELKPLLSDGRAQITLPLESRGYGALLSLDPGREIPAALALALKQAQTSPPLSKFSDQWRFLPQTMVRIKPTLPASAPPPGMLGIPGGEFDFRVGGIEIEGENRVGMDVQYPWEDSPRRGHVQRLTLQPFFIDRYPVSNAEFKVFVDAAHYRPADAHNFLKHWVDGAPAPGDEQRPVTWVSLEDARAYAAWAGKRLPHEWEWQYAAQGRDGRRYPWGEEWNAAAVPPPYLGRDLPAAPLIGQHPQGASPFGVEDLVGTVWQWTDEFVDEHTRAAILRGGSFYQPQGSAWYFPQAYKLSEHGKYLLMAPSKDRAGALGFRCVKDSR